MKKGMILFAGLLSAVLFSCAERDETNGGKAVLRLSFAQDALPSRAALSAADTSNYRLTVRDEKGKSIYDDLWGSRPREMLVDAGTYSVRVESREFGAPAFDAPQYGDFRVLTLSEGQSGTVTLVCSQQNAGVRLDIKDNFIATYKDANLYLRSSSGTLAYGYDETRTAFFSPGKVVLLMNLDGSETVLYSRFMALGEMLCLELSAAERMPLVKAVMKLGLDMKVDSSRIWISDALAFDGSSPGGGGGTPDVNGAVSVAEARAMAGSKSVWVSGYIVGGDLTSASASFSAPFTSRTNLLLADSPDCRDRSKCMSVQLSKGDIRDALNLVDNASMLGAGVCLKGDVVEAYYKLPGLQNLSDYRL